MLMFLALADVDVDAVTGCVHPRPASVSILRHGCCDFLRYHRNVFICNASHCSLADDPSSGLLLAAWRSPDTIVKVGGCALLFFPLMILFAFLWTQTSLLRPNTLSRHSVECPRALNPATMSSEEIQYLLSQGRPSRSRYVSLDHFFLSILAR